jgi:hypothetical protein
VQSPDGRWVAQFSGLTPGETIYLNVKNTDGTSGAGLYQLVADFNTPAVNTRMLVQGSSNWWDTTQTVNMSVPESTFFHFGLEVWNKNSNKSAQGAERVRVSILNASGSTVASFVSGNGLNTAQVFLNAGAYTVRFEGLDSSSSSSGGVWYNWSGSRISDPIDVFDPNDQGNQTPPVLFTKQVASDDNDIWFITDPWSDPIG